MKRIDILYGNALYSVGGRELAEIQDEIAALTQNGGWLLVNDGEGARRDAYLWLNLGVPIALIPIPAPPSS
ncbi:hypothetical protein [Microbacterium yannicii]|uniref:hypothetical protein n=1 Tax=Microbacterium yannicii TaxID=671622 RepID=UPI00030D728E|nr:hypothetical protein [Microbacterium yannicii]